MPLVTSSINLTDEKRVKELEDRSETLLKLKQRRKGRGSKKEGEQKGSIQ